MKPFTARSIPLFIAVTTLVAYALLLPLTGFYWDDWPFAWLARFMGPASFIPAFRGFRPFLGPIFFLTTSLVPSNPLLWQVFALLVRFAAALSAWYALSNIWPAHKRQALAASALFLVFPGYSQHWVALTHINQEWLPLICYLLSFAFTALALRGRWPRFRRTVPPQESDDVPPIGRLHWGSTAVALLLLVAGLFPTEYFIGLEPVRFLFIWVMLSETGQRFWSRFWRALRLWLPYLLIWLADAAWLLYYYKSGAYVSYDLTAVQAVPSLSEAFLAFADALWKAGVYVWFQVLVLCGRALTTPTSLLTFVVILLSLAAALFYFLQLRVASLGGRSFYRSAIFIGVVGILLGRIPSFIAGLPLTLQSSFDRFMISMMLPAAILAVGLLELITSVRLRTFLLALLLALGVGQQFFNANIFRRDWSRQQEIYWQMAWRMPALKPGTALVTQQMPLDYETDFSMTAAVNWIYAPQPHPASLPYALVYSEKRLGGVVLPSLEPHTPMHLPYRVVDFNGNTSQVVVIFVAPNGCLRVLDPALEDADTYGKYPDSVTAPIALSDPSRIITNVPSPSLPASPFGKEPPHTWCYYYEKAELARQQQQWNEVVQLAAQANLAGYAPEDPFEWLPFIEGYARSNNLPPAEQITRNAWAQDPKLHRGLCLLWQRLARQASPATQAAAVTLLAQLGCGQ